MDVSDRAKGSAITTLKGKALMEQISAITGLTEVTIQEELGEVLPVNPSVDELRLAVLNYLESLHQEYQAEFDAKDEEEEADFKLAGK